MPDNYTRLYTTSREIIDIVSKDSPGRIRFYGTKSAELFARECEESLEAVLYQNYYSIQEGSNAGFVSASVDGRPWTDTMWTRDAGVFIREMVHWGYLGHACLTADCLMGLVQKNEQGFYTFPERFDLGAPASGSELDGTNAITIGMVLLWKRLPETHPMKGRIYEFLHGESSPLRYIDHVLKSTPLLPGSGEFGGGCGIEGLFYNVVQNSMGRLALLAAAGMEREAGDDETAAKHEKNAEQLAENVGKYLTGEDGTWTWCVDTESFRPDPEILNHPINKGFGGLNGVASMYSDVLGLEPVGSGWDWAEACSKTFDKLASHPVRRDQFEKYGMWTQFDEFMDGLFTGPSYGHGYATQSMLLFDRLEMADRALDYLAEATFRPPKKYKLDRKNPYWFFERYPSPEVKDWENWWEGCGALNLVCVAEPLKIARLIIGIDDVSSGDVTIIPRIPPSWTGYSVKNWPVLTSNGVVRVDIECRRSGDGLSMRLKTASGGVIPALSLKLRVGDEIKTLRYADVTELDVAEG